MNKLRVPTIHLNGTSRDSLLQGYREAINALHAAGVKLAAACPNGRDYYIQKGNAISEAMEQHQARINKLREVATELEQIAEAIRMKIIKWDGKPISKNGIYSDIPLGKYHSQICDGPSFSSTNLRRILECNGGSPKHMFHEWSGNPKRAPEKESREMTIGRAAHHLLLGEPNFTQHYCIRPVQWDSWRTDAAKDWRTRMEKAGYGVLTYDDFQLIEGMANSLKDAILLPSDDLKKPAMHVYELLTGQIEFSFFWKDVDTGIWLKARPDAITTPTDFADLKTTASVQYNDLLRILASGAHHQQAANVAEGARVCADLGIETFALVYIERDPPHCVRPVFFKPDDIKRGTEQNRAALTQIGKCLQTGYWPGPGGGRVIEHIDLPDWYRSSADFEISEIKRQADADRRS